MSFSKNVASRMGDVAVVYAETVMGYPDDEYHRKAVRKTRAKPRPGWVVGCRHLSEGTYYEGETVSSGGVEPEPYWEPPGLAVLKRVPVLLVAYWPNLKPVFVQAGDLEYDYEALPYPAQAATVADYLYEGDE